MREAKLPSVRPLYNWHRYYDPKIGRYITSDPIGLRGGFNTYSYVRSNPLRWIDARGLDIAGGWEPGDLPASAPVGGSFGFGGFGILGSGGSASASVAWDSTGNVCWTYTICGSLGYAMGAGIGVEGSVGVGKLCEGTFRSKGGFWMGGIGPVAEGTIQSSGDDVSFGRGILGIGGGTGWGASMCVTKVFGCTNPEPCSTCSK